MSEFFRSFFTTLTAAFLLVISASFAAIIAKVAYDFIVGGAA